MVVQLADLGGYLTNLPSFQVILGVKNYPDRKKRNSERKKQGKKRRNIGVKRKKERKKERIREGS